MASIAIIDYGMGNLRSVAKARTRRPTDAGARHQNRQDILHADRVVSRPGFDPRLRELIRWDLVDVVREAFEQTVLGLCLGPQALLTFGRENGGIDGLDVLPGRVVCSARRDPSAAERLQVPSHG